MTTETQVEVAGTPAPVVLEDTKPEVTNTPEATAASGEVEEQKQAPEKVFTQAEVDALIQRRLLKEERRAHRRIEAQQREQQTAQIAKVAPNPSEYADAEEYRKAEIKHQAAALAVEMLAERDMAEKLERRAETFYEKADKASERYPDFLTVVGNPALAVNEHMAEFIAESELGDEVAYHLGKNPLKAAQISKMTAVGAVRELTRLENELASKPKAKPSNAPEPIKPVGTRGKPTSSALPSDDDPVEVWMKKEQARVRSR